MRSFPLIVITALLFCLMAAPTPASAQHLRCDPCNHGFSKVQIGTSATFNFQLSNTGTKLLTISSKSEQGSGFSFGTFALPVKLQPGASVNLPVIFTPTKKGYAMGVISLKSNDPSSPRTMNVHGVGFYPSVAELGLSPSSLNFGNVNVGSNATLPVTLTASDSAVTITSDQTNSSEFVVLGLNLPVTIQAGQSVQATIQFTPNASGKAVAKAAFLSNAVNSPTVEQLTGTGVAAQSHSVYLTWDPGDGHAVGYNVYRGTVQAGPFTLINTALDSSTNYTDSTVASGTTYYYVTTEVNDQGQESGYSNEVSAKIPSP